MGLDSTCSELSLNLTFVTFFTVKALIFRYFDFCAKYSIVHSHDNVMNVNFIKKLCSFCPFLCPATSDLCAHVHHDHHVQHVHHVHGQEGQPQEQWVGGGSLPCLHPEEPADCCGQLHACVTGRICRWGHRICAHLHRLVSVAAGKHRGHPNQNSMMSMWNIDSIHHPRLVFLHS